MIKFPKMHIAASVQNRILNLADELEAGRRIAAPGNAPAVLPDVQDTVVQSNALDTALATGLPALPGIDEAPDPGATLAGTPLLDTVLEPGE